jgi:streptogramin lyase
MTRVERARRAIGRRTAIAALAAVGSLLAACSLAAAASAVQITEYSLPAGAKPDYITSGPGGDMWFTDSGTNTIGRITPSGEVTEFGLGITPAAGLAGIAAGPDGNVWFTERTGHKIGRITPSGAITEFSTGLTANTDIYGITAGPEKDMWFTETFNNHIGKIDPSTGKITELPAGQSGAIFTKIVAGPDGNLWYTVSNQALIGKMTPTGTSTSSNALPSSDCTSGYPASCPYPESIAVGREDDLWFDEATGNAIGRITTTGLISEYTGGLTHGAHVADLAAGPEGNMWFTESAVDQVGRITPSGTISEFGSGISKGAKPFGIALGPDENLWVTENATGKIARVIPDVPPVAATGAASSVSLNAAGVNGTVRSRGADTHYYFEYGPTLAYGQTTSSQDNGSGDNVQSVGAQIAGLAPGVAYHYRLVAANANGTSYGQDETFATPPAPPTVTVGPFAIYFRGHVFHRRDLRLSDVFVIYLHPGERASYICERCHGSPARAAQTISGTIATFRTHELTVSARSLIVVTVTDPNGSRRVRTYGFSIKSAETTLKGEQCFLPGSGPPVPCPGGAAPPSHRAKHAKKHRVKHAKKRPAKHGRHGKRHKSSKRPKRRARHKHRARGRAHRRRGK